MGWVDLIFKGIEFITNKMKKKTDTSTEIAEIEKRQKELDKENQKKKEAEWEELKRKINGQ